MNLKTFYKITNKLFDPKNPPFQSEGYQQLIKRLHFLLDIDGIALITGESGVGKTYLTDKVFEYLDSKQCLVLRVNSYRLKQTMVSGVIATALKIDHYYVDAVTISRIHIHMQELFNQGKKVIFIIENAEELDAETIMTFKQLLDELRQYSASFIFIGQNKLKTTLENPYLKSFKDKVVITCNLLEFTEQESKDYIIYLLNNINLDSQTFTDSAYLLLHKASNGVAGKINTLFAKCLLIGASYQHKQIDQDVVNIAIEDDK